MVVYGLTRGDWLNGLLAGITLAMAMLPEEFPVVLTIFLALGAWRLSQRQVLTRRVPAIETLGAATVLCVDKTGTLTLNRMAVSRICASGQVHEVAGGSCRTSPRRSTRWSSSRSSPASATRSTRWRRRSSSSASATWPRPSTCTTTGRWCASTRCRPSLLALSRVWRSPDTDDYVIAAKGAPEAIADLCHLDEPEARMLAADVAAMASDGLRVLGVARATFRPRALPGEQHDFAFEFLGLVGLADPVRPTAVAAVGECRTAGIRVVMITGDYPGTAQNIARQVGLPAEPVVTGPELDAMSEAELRECVRRVSLFARVVPEQKLRLVEALKANGEVVAMTGDGVNDAPALKAANIGIAMGGRGTDVAREAASLVLLDDDFTSIVQAVRLGRRIFDNLKKAMAYIFAIHVPIAGMSLIPVLFGWPLVLLPVHIVFLELIIDPACSIVFEAEGEEADVMNRPPRDPGERLFGARTVGVSLVQGLVVLAAVAGMFASAQVRGYGETEARALSFTTLIVANLGLIFANRSWSQTIVSQDRVAQPGAVVGGGRGRGVPGVRPLRAGAAGGLPLRAAERDRHGVVRRGRRRERRVVRRAETGLPHAVDPLVLVTRGLRPASNGLLADDPQEANEDEDQQRHEIDLERPQQHLRRLRQLHSRHVVLPRSSSIGVGSRSVLESVSRLYVLSSGPFMMSL